MEITRTFRIVLLVVLAFGLIRCSLGISSEPEEEFVPTHEWQVVKEGQKIPKGLHVRININTGLKEAKILDEEKTSSAVLVQTTNQKIDTEEESLNSGNIKISEARLKEALKNIKNDSPENTKVKNDNRFRSYDELKKDLSDLNLNPKSDSEVLKDLVKKFKKLIHVKHIDTLHVLSVMEDIDYLIHQLDNAVEFVRLKGIEEVIYKNLNSTITEIKLESIKLLGSLVQNNAKVQIYALETGALDFLLRTLVLNSNNAIKSRTVFALSSLMRRFPLAQLKFIENAGLNVFFELVSNTNDIKIQLKIVTFLNDLVLEYIDALNDNDQPEKRAQYINIDLKHKLFELDWCKYLTNLLKNIYEIDKNDHDGLEKSLNAILSVVDDCKTSYTNNVHYILEDLQLHYNTLAAAASHSDDEFDVDHYKHLESLCSAIINYSNIVKKIKTEL